jgi:hypothetical protein
LNTGAGWQSAPSFNLPDVLSDYNGKDPGTRLLDLNGDGLPDLVRSVWVSSSYSLRNTWLNTGSGWLLSSSYAAPDFISDYNGIDPGTQLIDLNGDGLLDFVRAVYVSASGKTTKNAWLNSGVGWQLVSGFNLPDILSDYNGKDPGTKLVDLNGDGLPDMVRSVLVNGTRMSGVSINVSPARGLLSIDSGSTVATSYMAVGSGSSAYSADSAQTYPRANIQSPMQVVSSVKQSNGLGGMNETTYSYGGLKAEQASAQYPGSGRGMLGFRWMKSREESTGIESYTEFAQTWPYIGMPVKSETRLAGAGNGGVLKRVTTNYGCYQSNVVAGGAAPASAQTGCLPGWSAGKVYFPFATSIAEESWDLNGTSLPVLLTTQAYGGYADGAGGAIKQFGDPTEVRVDISEGGVLKQRKLSSNEYQPAKTDGSNWELGRLKRASVTSSQY